MRYLSDDGKVFNTEQDCCEHEQKVTKEKVNREQREKLQKIKSTYEELEKLVSEYGQLYGFQKELYFAPSCSFIDALCLSLIHI